MNKKKNEYFVDLMFVTLADKITRPIAFFDIESTGLDVDNDRIIQITFYILETTGITKKTYWVMPDVEIKPGALEVHGITKEMLIEKGAKPFKEYALEISDLLIGCDIAGYNILRFDIPMLENELYRADIKEDFSQRKIIDIQRMYRKLFSHSLTGAYENLTGSERVNAHEAEQDVLDTMIVLGEMVKNFEVGQENDSWIDFAGGTGDMVDYAGKFKIIDNRYVYNFGKDIGLPVQDNPGLLEWMLSKNFPRNTIMWAERLLDLIHETGVAELRAIDDDERGIEDDLI